MSSSASPQVPILRWVMLALLTAVIWTLFSGQISGIMPGPQDGLIAANKSLDAGDIKKATVQFNTVVRNYPANVEVYEMIADICTAHKHSEIAVHLLEDALGPCKDLPRPERARIYLALAAACSSAEPKPQYRSIYAAQRAAELDPTSPKILNAYGYFLADNNVDLDVAVAKLTLALQLLKKQDNGSNFFTQLFKQPGEILEDESLPSMTEDSYGWALYKQGKYDLSSAALYQAINDVPEEISSLPANGENLKVLYYHLGASYRQQHKPDESRKALLTALSLAKGYKEAQDELNALDKEFPPPAPRNGTAPTNNSKPPAASPASAPSSTKPSPPTQESAPEEKA